jgi:hypothetical protein
MVAQSKRISMRAAEHRLLGTNLKNLIKITCIKDRIETF